MLTFLGGGRGCAGALTRPSTRHLLPKNFEKTALRKRVGIFSVNMRGGHIYGNYFGQNHTLLFIPTFTFKEAVIPCGTGDAAQLAKMSGLFSKASPLYVTIALQFVNFSCPGNGRWGTCHLDSRNGFGSTSQVSIMQ